MKYDELKLRKVSHSKFTELEDAVAAVPKVWRKSQMEISLRLMNVALVSVMDSHSQRFTVNEFDENTESMIYPSLSSSTQIVARGEYHQHKGVYFLEPDGTDEDIRKVVQASNDATVTIEAGEAISDSVTAGSEGATDRRLTEGVYLGFLRGTKNHEDEQYEISLRLSVSDGQFRDLVRLLQSNPDSKINLSVFITVFSKSFMPDCFIDNHNEPVLAFVSRLRVESRYLSNGLKDEIEAGSPSQLEGHYSELIRVVRESSSMLREQNKLIGYVMIMIAIGLGSIIGKLY